jgi:hypothetical protein
MRAATWTDHEVDRPITPWCENADKGLLDEGDKCDTEKGPGCYLESRI